MRLEPCPAPPGDRIPNHPSFAVLIYHDVGAAKDGPDAARALFAEVEGARERIAALPAPAPAPSAGRASGSGRRTPTDERARRRRSSIGPLPNAKEENTT